MKRDNDYWLPRILPHLKVTKGPDAKGDHRCWCVFHPDGQGTPPHNPNMTVGPKGWYCPVCDKGGPLREVAEKLGLATEAQSRGREVAVYNYFNTEGTLIYQSVRLESPKGFYLRHPDGNGGFVKGLNGSQPVLYHLPELVARPDEIVWIPEGEKDCDRLAGLGLLSTTNPMGAKKWRTEYSECLRNRHVVLLADNDTPGEEHVEVVARSLHGVATSTKIIRFPELPEKGDVSDWLARGHTVDELQDLAKAAPSYVPMDSTVRTESLQPVKPKSRAKGTQADTLIAIAEDSGVELRKDTQGEPVCFIPVNGHREIWPCGNRHLKAWLTRQYQREEGRAPNLTALNTAINVLDAKARLDGESVELHNRVAGSPEEIWIDLSNPDWSAIRVTSAGWDIVANPPIPFRRYKHQKPQVTPARGGSVDKLLQYVNVVEPHNRLLLLLYVISTFIPSIPHPVCVLYGPKGSSKSTLSRMIRKLIDPSLTPVLALPTEPDRLAQTLDHNWLAPFDNVSGFPRWVSDALCRAATGDGLTKRALFTNDDDFIFTFKRCVVLNGINISAVQADLLDRSLLIGLAPISSKTRQSEEEMWASFESDRPRILGAILDIISEAMALKPRVFTSELPRMADFAHWGMAIAEAMGRKSEDFLRAYDTNVSHQSEEAVNAHPVSVTLLEFIMRRDQWEGSPTELLSVLTEEAAKYRVDVKSHLWPGRPNQLSNILNELGPSLADLGVSIDRDRDGHHGRRLHLKYSRPLPATR